MHLLSTKRDSSETCRNFGPPFAASVAKLNTHASNALANSLTAFMLLANSNIDSNQKICILAAGTSNHSTLSNLLPLTDQDLLNSVKYEPIASILRQCDKANSSQTPLQANSTTLQRKKRAPEQIAKLKAQSQCKICNNRENWHTDYNKDGTIKPGINSLKERPEKSLGFSSQNITRKKAVTCHLAKLSSNKAETSDLEFRGPLLDDGALHSGIGIDELKIMSPYLRKNRNGNIEPLPASIVDRTHWQYRTGSHARDPRKMLVSVMLTDTLADGTEVDVGHVVIEGSSQWVTGRNVTSKCEVIHTNGNYIQLPNSVQTVGKCQTSY